MTSRDDLEPNTECSVCEKAIYREPYKIKNLDNSYCSDKCYKADKGIHTKDCDHCGDAIEVLPHRLEKYENHYCSNECQGKWVSENKTYESPYDKKWYRVRREARARDDYECKACGSEDNLEVHHVVPARIFVNSEDAHQLENLVTLCREHHMDIEGARKDPKKGEGGITKRFSVLCTDSDIGKIHLGDHFSSNAENAVRRAKEKFEPITTMQQIALDKGEKFEVWEIERETEVDLTGETWGDFSKEEFLEEIKSDGHDTDTDLLNEISEEHRQQN